IKCENTGELVSILARSLSPDNVTGIRTEVDKDSATVTFSADKIGTMLSSVDDYLMNAKIAFDMIEKVKNSDHEI
ncbi:MAG TPA: KEOPS complex subunit Pcc1, partial [Candidatus Hodarchaeales archaeon]|nr:KEOPS complex subunit Pcc1 [Candidatus Hodarchaeales archaeon]